MRELDLILVGGGLANGLIAYHLKRSRPDVRFLLLEAGSRLGGDHTWSFHGSDVAPEARAWLDTLCVKRWDGHGVRFPAFGRKLAGEYASIRSERFHAVAGEALADDVLFDTPVARLAPTEVTLADGRKLRASAVIDGRGFGRLASDRVAYQKFLGIDVTLTAPHGLTRPVLMDVTCEQRDGFRFIYVLPWSETSLLIEDTRYSDTPEVSAPEYRDEIRRYAAARGWQIAHEGREEIGCLPIPLSESFLAGDAGLGASPRDLMRESRVPAVGVRAGFFHPTTGYSLPDAVRIAKRFAEMRDFRAEAVRESLETYGRETELGRSFFRFLNRMLFEGAQPATRYRVLERFYRLPEALVNRFYAGRLAPLDYCRILVGKPPIPMWRALSCVPDPAGGPLRSLTANLFLGMTASEVAR